MSTPPPDHCGACQIVRELTDHRNLTAPVWGVRRATLNFAIVIARSVCPKTRELDEETPT